MKENIGETICQYRQNLKMTQEEFAYRLGVTPQAVSRWERGSGLPDLALLKGICQILHISADTLLEISDDSITETRDIQAGWETNLFAEPIAVEFGAAVIPFVAEGLKTDYVHQKRKELARRYGILMPILRLRDNPELEENTYRILSYDNILYEGRLESGCGDSDPTGPYFEILDRTAEECRNHYSRILNKQLVKIMIDRLEELYPGVAHGLVPERISYLRLADHLRDMLEKGQSVRDLIHILEQMERNL